MHPLILLPKRLQDLKRFVFGAVIYKAEFKFHIFLGKIRSDLPDRLIKIRQRSFLVVAWHDHRK